jgi:hypothetical protein
LSAGEPPYIDPDWGTYEHYEPAGRKGLEAVLMALTKRARRELTAIIGRIDARVIQHTYGNDPDGPGWWIRRM